MGSILRVFKLALHPLEVIPWFKDWGEIVQLLITLVLTGTATGVLAVVFGTLWGLVAALAITTLLFFVAALRIQYEVEATKRKSLCLYYDVNDPMCRDIRSIRTYDSRSVYVTCRVKVKALGPGTLDEVRVVLLQADTHTFYGCVFRPMNAGFRESGEFKLHPGADEYVEIV
jgi:hypothetical protein